MITLDKGEQTESDYHYAEHGKHRRGDIQRHMTTLSAADVCEYVVGKIADISPCGDKDDVKIAVDGLHPCDELIHSITSGMCLFEDLIRTHSRCAVVLLDFTVVCLPCLEHVFKGLSAVLRFLLLVFPVKIAQVVIFYVLADICSDLVVF